MFVSRLIIYTLFLLLVMGASFVTQAQNTALTGPTTLDKIIEADHVFQIYMDRYTPDDLAVEHLKTVEDSLTLHIFMGTWCRESKKYLPGLIKTLQVVDSPHIAVKYIAVDPSKKYPEKFLKTFNIKYIPTVVVFRGNEEIGRIEEVPQELIENDLIQILTKQANSSN